MDDESLRKSAAELDEKDNLAPLREEFKLPVFGAVGADLIHPNEGELSGHWPKRLTLELADYLSAV
jgi:hypothetical protein